MRVIADAIGLASEDFQSDQIVDNSESIFTGFTTILVDDQKIDNFYEKKKVYLDNRDLYPNQYIMMVSNANEKKSALGRFISPSTPIKQLSQKKKGHWLPARNHGRENGALADANPR